MTVQEFNAFEARLSAVIDVDVVLSKLDVLRDGLSACHSWEVGLYEDVWPLPGCDWFEYRGLKFVKTPRPEISCETEIARLRQLPPKNVTL